MTTDLHNHLVPAVDDGARDLAESRAALAAMHAQGVRALATTPHLEASLLERPSAAEPYLERVSEAWEELRALAAADFPDVSLERGFEVMLDTPFPDLSDERVRLAGGPHVLVEFPHVMVPPRSVDTIFHLKTRGWMPLIAHPERYRGMDAELRTVGEWRRVGGLLQVNCGSLAGRYGRAAQSRAWRLLELGWADCLASDYHARGECAIAGARAQIQARGGAEQVELLLEENPRRLLDGLEPVAVPPLPARKPLWRRVFGGVGPA